MTRTPGPEMVRFTLVAVIGLLLDLGTALALSALVGLPLFAAAVVGFVAGGTFNYVVHELWTFPGGTRTLSYRRWWAYLAGVSLILGLRLAALAALEAFAPGGTEGDFRHLLLSAALSFMVNFVLAKFVIFRSSRALASQRALRPGK